MNKTKNIAIFIGLAVTAWLIYYFNQIVAYILIAWVLSLLGKPVMDFLMESLNFKKLKIGRTLSAIVVLLLYMFLGVLGTAVLIPLLLEQAQILTAIDYSSIARTLEEPLSAFNESLTKIGVAPEDGIHQNDIQELLLSWINPDKIGYILSSFFALAGQLLVGILAILFISFFFLKDKGLFANIVTALAPRGTEKDANKALDDITYLLTRYFGGIVIQISIITFFVTGLLYLFGISNALLIGFFAAVINVIPFVGPLIGAMFGVFITLTTNIDIPFYDALLPKLTKVVIVFASMQLMDNLLIQPYVFSNRIKAHPLEIFLVILVGAQIGGVLGMILAIPSYTVIRAVANVFFSNFKLVQRMTKNLDD